MSCRDLGCPFCDFVSIVSGTGCLQVLPIRHGDVSNAACYRELNADRRRRREGIEGRITGTGNELRDDVCDSEQIIRGMVIQFHLTFVSLSWREL